MIPSNSMVFLTDDDALVRRCVSRLLRSAGRRLLDLLTPHEFEVMRPVVTGMLNDRLLASQALRKRPSRSTAVAS